MAVLLCGGAGFVGTHTLVHLLEAGHKVIVVDNFANSSSIALERVKQITKKEFVSKSLNLATEPDKLDQVFEETKIDAVIHLAGLKAVGESISMPVDYYENNIRSTLNILRSMEKFNCSNIIFSSSATVYGDPHTVPITEDFPVGVGLTNPYGKTKYFIEEILKDYGYAQTVAGKPWRCVLLRYFNPVGAHKSGLIGEDPRGKPNNLLPFICQVAVGRRAELSVFGNDFPTPDGTGVRDYLHVDDLAAGHVAALEKVILNPTESVSKAGPTYVYNLGRCSGVSVLEMRAAMEKASGRKIPYKITARRPGDIATCYADASKAKKDLKWEAKHDLQRICEDAWRWQSNNPHGYDSELADAESKGPPA